MGQKTDENIRLAKMCETKAGLSELRELPAETQLKALKNWTATLTVSHVYFKTVMGRPEARKTLIYNWQWDYSPLWTFKDRVALAWSNGFAADETPTSLYRKYETPWPTGKEQIAYEKYTREYADYDVNCGAAAEVDIQSSATVFHVCHRGTFKVNLTLNPASFALASAKGCYIHVKLFPNIGLNFSSSPSIGVSGSLIYEKSAETARKFYTTSSADPNAAQIGPIPGRPQEEYI